MRLYIYIRDPPTNHQELTFMSLEKRNSGLGRLLLARCLVSNHKDLSLYPQHLRKHAPVSLALHRGGEFLGVGWRSTDPAP